MSLLNYIKPPESFKSELEPHPLKYKDQAVLILLDRLKTSDPIDLLPIVSALKELLSDNPTEELVLEKNVEFEDDSDKRHWKPV